MGKVFHPIGPWNLVHFGQLWELVRKDYPSHQHAAPVIDPDKAAVDEATLAPFPRLWFVSEDQSRLLQFQVDRIYFNWRNRGGDYPRFENLLAEYSRYSTIVDTFLASQLGVELKPDRYDLSYINGIDQGAQWETLSDISSLFSASTLPVNISSFGKAVTARWEVLYELPEKLGTLKVSIDPAKNNRTAKNAVRLDIIARGNVADLGGMSEYDWLRRAHDAIVNGFKELGSDRALKIWGYQP